MGRSEYLARYRESREQVPTGNDPTSKMRICLRFVRWGNQCTGVNCVSHQRLYPGMQWTLLTLGLGDRTGCGPRNEGRSRARSQLRRPEF